ncbi:hypothetical protein DICVIV_09183 [Dictyocaulus viviparus]|uniref:Uncharacterized protein n=1 Tax=Dictyocaulus viviparus TaxID=29172 RepID=A0A0D8XLX0_DICVI|nr:hypothetical protein DICVIV_09183 [Dictyocaulus viviparus]
MLSLFVFLGKTKYFYNILRGSMDVIRLVANQSVNDDNPLNSVLRQTLAAGTLNQQLQQVQNQLQFIKNR